MNAKSLTVAEVMHAAPHTIGADQKVEVAKKQMINHGVRHLPVLDGGRCVGILSDRDIKLAYAVEQSKAADLQVKEICTAEVYEVAPSELLRAVAKHMADAAIGSAVISDRGKVLGIFTTTDACRILAKLA